jgi:ferredoxin
VPDNNDHTERTIAGVTVRIDRLLCVGFGDCIGLAADAFVFDDEGIVIFAAGAESVARERLLEACAACPVDALTVIAPDGAVLVP